MGAAVSAAWLREQLYTRTGHKQVPPLVLNADEAAQQAFLRGFYAGDGLKRGNGMSFVTNSPVLAQGLCWLYHLDGQPASVYVERREAAVYYRVNLASAVRVGAKGAHLRRDPAEVRRIVEIPDPQDEWVFDIETESGVLCAGVGRLVVHNSPRRGLEFVTRKITWHAAAIKLGLTDKLTLGNLDAERDWGYAKDYVEAMWLMLQQDDAEDFVIATGVAHTVRDCVEIAFDQAGLEIGDHVEIDESLKRPAEVDQLIGDASKAKRELGWDARDDLRGAHPPDGRRRPAAALRPRPPLSRRDPRHDRLALSRACRRQREPPGACISLLIVPPTTDALRRSPLDDRHRAAGAKLIPFAGWEMPVQYAGIKAEHLAVRGDAGVFDVSHMGQIETAGPGRAGPAPAPALQRRAAAARGRRPVQRDLQPRGRGARRRVHLPAGRVRASSR